MNENSINIPVSINAKKRLVDTESLIDSGAGGIFIDQNFTRQIGLKTIAMDKPILARNVDGTINKKGTIKNYVDLEFTINNIKFEERFYVTGLGKQKMILGLPWLTKQVNHLAHVAQVAHLGTVLIIPNEIFISP